jgi:hypothetical protein
MLDVHPPATPEEAAAIAAAIALVLAEEADAAAEAPAPALDGWATAARVEALGIVRRIPGQLDLRYMSAPTRERLTRPARRG